MFIADADKSCLRQGDILGGIPFPLVTPSHLILLGSIKNRGAVPETTKIPALMHEHRKDSEWLTAQLSARMSFCAIISQCCSLEPSNDRLRCAAISVARLIPIPQNILKETTKLESLRENKDPRLFVEGSGLGVGGFIGLFYIPAHPLLENKEWVVDYSQFACIPASEYPGILTHKLVQMDDRWRVKFKIKLGFHLSRLTDEEHKNQLEEPWGKEAEDAKDVSG